MSLAAFLTNKIQVFLLESFQFNEIIFPVGEIVAWAKDTVLRDFEWIFFLWFRILKWVTFTVDFVSTTHFSESKVCHTVHNNGTICRASWQHVFS